MTILQCLYFVTIWQLQTQFILLIFTSTEEYKDIDKEGRQTEGQGETEKGIYLFRELMTEKKIKQNQKEIIGMTDIQKESEKRRIDVKNGRVHYWHDSSQFNHLDM